MESGSKNLRGRVADLRRETKLFASMPAMIWGNVAMFTFWNCTWRGCQKKPKTKMLSILLKRVKIPSAMFEFRNLVMFITSPGSILMSTIIPFVSDLMNA